MKILLLCWRDSTHPQGGGSERYLERVGEYLAQQGHEVVYRTAGHTDAPRRSQRDGVRYSRSGGKYTVYPKALAGILLGRLGVGTLRGIDVVVDTQNGIPFFARLVSGVPTVLLTHHCHKEQWPVAGPVIGRLGWLLESAVAPRVYRGAQYVTVSEASKTDLVNLGINAEDVEIIANGVDSVPKHIPRLDTTADQRIATLSRLVPHKQIEHAMEIVAAVDNVVLDVIGSGWWEDRLRAYAEELGVSDRVVFHGQVTEDYKHALLARAAVHVMPSRKEGWGLAVVEAAQHGVPTVGYRDAGGLRDSIRHGQTGILVDDRASLLRAVRGLLHDDATRTAMGDAARAWATSFSWADTGQRWERLLTDLVDAPATATTEH